MHKFIKSLKIAAYCLPLLTSSVLYGSEAGKASHHLSTFINEIKPATVKKEQIEGLLNAKSLDEKISICAEIKENTKYLDLAREAGLGNLKALRLSEICMSFQPPKHHGTPGQLEEGRYPKPGEEHKSTQHAVGKLSAQAATPPAARPAAASPTPKLVAKKIAIPAEFLKADASHTAEEKIEHTKKTLQVLEIEMKEHASDLDPAEKERIEAQLGLAKENLKKAEEDYEHMKFAVEHLRHEVLEANHREGAFKAFNPEAHASKSHEDYLTHILTFTDDLKSARARGMGAAIDQFEGSKKVLDGCKAELEKARKAIEEIGR
ncbi:MAG: hypothetical protein FJX71_05585 [Alphaproteobacteria bacterium]|nr:hypothetical protein [Alphaproteobacteria bacterium]